jgi:hypothetical protein
MGDVKLRVAQITIDYPHFLEKTLGDLITKHILEKIHKQMRRDGISEKIIESTVSRGHDIDTGYGGFTVTGKNAVQWNIVSDYKSIDGFPVAVMIEHGRRAFFVKPKEPTKDRPHPTLKYEIDDTVYFSKGHKIPEYRARKYVSETIRKNKKKVQRELSKKTKEFIRTMMGDHVVRP